MIFGKNIVCNSALYNILLSGPFYPQFLKMVPKLQKILSENFVSIFLAIVLFLAITFDPLVTSKSKLEVKSNQNQSDMKKSAFINNKRIIEKDASIEFDRKIHDSQNSFDMTTGWSLRPRNGYFKAHFFLNYLSA